MPGELVERCDGVRAGELTPSRKACKQESELLPFYLVKKVHQSDSSTPFWHIQKKIFFMRYLRRDEEVYSHLSSFYAILKPSSCWESS